jgi:pimeloyl-ACP methyl ester carboxylesterase
MPYIEINAAQIYYETYGKNRPGLAPILLIHGSTITGQEDWLQVAPLLARRWRVIVPDCRGHGKSSNPKHSYSFKEMAADMAALVRALGYTRAHIIGHSNGGNVALVTLMEHPDVVQTAIPQAANAYVSQDLIEHEPANFNPVQIERERPEWMAQMIALHGPTHGPDYWRELVQLTLQETISQPNYTPEDLQRVQRPVLVIQGAEDRVNAPSRHGQFIARHIPFAERWIPEGVGHNVHDEVLFEWIERVENFLSRRGTDANEALYRLQAEKFPDERDAIFDVWAQEAPGEAGQPATIHLAGKVLTEDDRQAALAALQPLPADASKVRVLLTESTPWGLVQRGVTDLRRTPSNRAERVSQALMGDAVRILDEQDGWAWVRMERDGYMGWLHERSVYHASQEEVEAYLAAREMRVVAALLPANVEPEESPSSRDLVAKLPFGVSLPVEKLRGGLAKMRLPDGQHWWVFSSGLLPESQCPKLNKEGIEITLKLIQRFIGVPYLWGGCTPFGFDCSGLAAAFYRMMGLNLLRDADQQFRLGKPVESPYEPGDLLFFGRPELDQPSPRFNAITHVAISLGDDEIIHANGYSWSTAYNSLNPAHPGYRADLVETLVGAKRYR